MRISEKNARTPQIREVVRTEARKLGRAAVNLGLLAPNAGLFTLEYMSNIVRRPDIMAPMVLTLVAGGLAYGGVSSLDQKPLVMIGEGYAAFMGLVGCYYTLVGIADSTLETAYEFRSIQDRLRSRRTRVE